MHCSTRPYYCKLLGKLCLDDCMSRKQRMCVLVLNKHVHDVMLTSMMKDAIYLRAPWPAEFSVLIACPLCPGMGVHVIALCISLGWLFHLGKSPAVLQLSKLFCARLIPLRELLPFYASSAILNKSSDLGCEGSIWLVYNHSFVPEVARPS